MGKVLSSFSKYKTHIGLGLLAIMLISGSFSILDSQNKPRVRDYFSVQASSIKANSGQNYIATNSVDMENSSIKIAQITDIHITINKADSIERFEKAVEEINSRDIDFVLLTGDLVDWSERPNWERFHEVYKKIQPPAFATVGNHDYRKNLLNVAWPAFPIPSWKPENQIALKYYYEHLTPASENLSENFSIDFGPSKGDFSFDYGSIHVVVLDSGHDVMKSEFGVQGSGLKNSQINWLENDLRKEDNIFVAMHHPVFDDENLTISSSIAYNRNTFLNMVKTHDVVTILAGHTHNTRSFNYQGVNHIQTGTPPAFRIITFDNNKMRTSIIGQPYEPKNGTIHMLGQVWAGVQWTHLNMLRTVDSLIGKPTNFIILGVIILTGIGLTYKFIMIRKTAR